MTNQLKRNILRDKFSVDLEVLPVQDEVKGKWHKKGYRYVISNWNEEQSLINRIYSDPKFPIFDTYEQAEEHALKYIEDYVAKV